jgi:threonine/homoserine/homoserine lactone efflux protein
MFFLAFLPQFVDADAPSKVISLITLGVLFNLVGTIWNVGVAWCAGTMATANAYVRTKAWLERTIGTLFIFVAIKLALTERP